MGGPRRLRAELRAPECSCATEAKAFEPGGLLYFCTFVTREICLCYFLAFLLPGVLRLGWGGEGERCRFDCIGVPQTTRSSPLFTGWARADPPAPGGPACGQGPRTELTSAFLGCKLLRLGGGAWRQGPPPPTGALPVGLGVRGGEPCRYCLMTGDCCWGGSTVFTERLPPPRGLRPRSHAPSRRGRRPPGAELCEVPRESLALPPAST